MIMLNKLQTFCLKFIKSRTCGFASCAIERSLGQPTSFTHPYLMQEGEVTPGLTKDDYLVRRQSLMKNFVALSQANKKHANKQNVLILFGDPVVYMTEDIPYPFHQNPNFRYLTGFLEPESCLIIEEDRNNSDSFQSLLLVPDRDQHKELWHGPRAGLDGAMALTGVDATDSFNNLPSILPKYISDKYNIWYDFHKPFPYHSLTTHMRQFLNEVFKKEISINSPTNTIQKLRHVKTDKEIALMFEAANITSQAFIRTMSSCFPDMNEGVIQAMIDCESRFQGAQMLAYPPVVAGGNRANTLHYICNNQRIKDGELVLVDAGAEYHGYVADVTRTWPVNGRFTPAQRKIYQSVLNIQNACIELCRPGTHLDAIYSAMVLLIYHELSSNGIVEKKLNEKQQYEIARKYCPHHVSHWLGMDVHDTGSVSRSTPLQPGMVVTIEPGIYIRSDDSDVPEEFRGIGIRIEDDVVITPKDPLVLSQSCPKEIDDIENLMKPQ